MTIRTAFSILCLGSAAVSCHAAEKVTFKASDGLEVTADLYLSRPATAPFVLLFHQAHSSRGEYLEIAPRLAALGFNAMAVDLRSGGGVNGETNETAARAREAKLPRNYEDAYTDLRAAIDFVEAKGYRKGKLLLWGSSYSASLVVVAAGDAPGSCDGILAFSPGEYFASSGDKVRTSAAKAAVPAFFASGPLERSDWQAIYDAIPDPRKTFYLPAKDGAHGSEALWRATKGNEGYWKAVEPFLAGFTR